MSLLAHLLLALLLVAQGAAAQVVRFPRPESDSDRRYDYTEALLRLVLSESAPQYRLEHAASPMNQDRQVTELEAGRTIDVAAVPASAEREARLLAVRIPISKGLLGWRLGLIRKGDAARFADVNTKEDLKRVRLGQAFEWPDVQILRANGVPVVTGPTYDGLFKMLDGGRFDYFPRDPLEIADELAAHPEPLEIEPRIALHYYQDAYYMVNRANAALAETLRQGLEKALADGSWDKLFDQFFGERVRRAQLDKRVIIELKNPMLTPGTPLDRPELWYDPRKK